MAYDMELGFVLSAKPKRVMQLLTDPKLIRIWSGEDAIVESEGGKFEMFDGWVTGKVLKATETELTYTWLADGQETEVHYTLKPDEAGTKVILKHTGFADEKEMESHRNGWVDFFFEPMEDYIMVTEKD